MTYAVNSAKKDPATGFVAVKTGMADPDKSWMVVLTADGTTNFVADQDVSAWADLA